MPNYTTNNPYVLLSNDSKTLELKSLSDVITTSKYYEATAQEVINAGRCMAYAVDFTNILDQSTWEYGVEKEFKFYGVLKAIQLDASNTVTVDGSTYTINSSQSHSPIYEPTSQGTQSAYEKGCIFFSLIKGDNVLYNRISTNMNQRVTISPNISSAKKASHNIKIVCKKQSKFPNSTTPVITLTSVEINIPYYTVSTENEGMLSYKWHLGDCVDYTQNSSTVQYLPIMAHNDPYFDDFTEVTLGVNLEGYVGNRQSVEFNCSTLLHILENSSSNNKLKMQLEINSIKGDV